MPVRKYTREILEDAVQNSVSIAGVLRHIGVRQAGGTQAHVSKMIKRYGIDTSHFTGRGHNKGQPARNLKDLGSILCIYPEGSFRPKRVQLFRAMMESGLDYICAFCYNNGEWQGNPLTLDIDHINGDWLDNRIGNLRFLCPNCHTQTETYGSKKR